MNIIAKIRAKAKDKTRTILLPEYNDPRILEAAKIIEKEKIAKPLVLTPDQINPQDKERYIEEFYQLRKHKGLDLNTAKKMLEKPLYYAAMLVREGKADGLVAGASHTTPDMVRAAIWCLGVNEKIGVVTSAFIMVVPNSPYGENGTFIFADCGIIPKPTPQQLATISLSAAEIAGKIFDSSPRVALLNYSTKGSAKSESGERISAAIDLLKEKNPSLAVDGELQLDAAIVPEVAKIKLGNSPVAGKANVLIFPNLEAGNIGYKLVQRLAGARAIGPILLGLNKPCSDLSRGCLVEDIVDVVAVTALQAQ